MLFIAAQISIMQAFKFPAAAVSEGHSAQVSHDCVYAVQFGFQLQLYIKGIVVMVTDCGTASALHCAAESQCALNVGCALHRNHTSNCSSMSKACSSYKSQA